MVKVQLRRQIWRTGVQAQMIGIKDRSFWNYSNRTTWGSKITHIYNAILLVSKPNQDGSFFWSIMYATIYTSMES